MTDDRPRIPRDRQRRPATHAIGVDVGGSGIKAAVVDTATGRLVSERLRVPTPDAVHAGARQRVDRAARPAAGEGGRASRRDGAGRRRPAGRRDRTGGLMTAANIDPAWVDYPIAEQALERC